MTEAPERRSGPMRGAPRPAGPPRGEGRRQPEPFRPIEPGDLRSIIVDGNTATMIQEAQRLARSLAGERPDARQATSTALRVVWGELRRIDLDWPTDQGRNLPLLKPKLAYLAGRSASVGRGVADVQQTMAPAIDLVGNDRDRFDRLVQFLEAVLAYFYAGPQFSGR